MHQGGDILSGIEIGADGVIRLISRSNKKRYIVIRKGEKDTDGNYKKVIELVPEAAAKTGEAVKMLENDKIKFRHLVYNKSVDFDEFENILNLLLELVGR